MKNSIFNSSKGLNKIILNRFLMQLWSLFCSFFKKSPISFSFLIVPSVKWQYPWKVWPIFLPPFSSWSCTYFWPNPQWYFCFSNLSSWFPVHFCTCSISKNQQFLHQVLLILSWKIFVTIELFCFCNLKYFSF